MEGSVLIELVDEYMYAKTPDKEFASKNSGYVRSDNYEELIDKRVWFPKYKDDAIIEKDGKTYTFIKYEDLLGYNDDQAE